jgi:putative redox protein
MDAPEAEVSVQQARVAIAVDLEGNMRFKSVGEDGVAVLLDSDAAHGGEGAGLRPMELMLVSLGSCTGMDVISILRKKRQDVTGYRIEVSGARRGEYPRVFTEIDVRHVLWGNDLSESAVSRAIELSESTYCPAYAMLSKAARITSSFELRPEIPAD